MIYKSITLLSVDIMYQFHSSSCRVGTSQGSWSTLAKYVRAISKVATSQGLWPDACIHSFLPVMLCQSVRDVCLISD